MFCMYGEDYSGRFRLWQCGMKGMVELQHCLLSMYAYIYIYIYIYIYVYKYILGGNSSGR